MRFIIYVLAITAFVGGTIYGTVNHRRTSTPANATAICQDGSYGLSTPADVACANHGGVAWRR